MKFTETFPRTVREIPHQIIRMPDGCELSARIWLPDDALSDPVPAIIEHLPYRKRDGTIVRDQLTHPWFAGHGYACIRVDMRGNGDSQGLMHDEYTDQELEDACSVIDWATSQPFCTGSVGMMGISWGGFNALQVAALRPPSLKAIITLCSTVDRFSDDIHFKGGCLLGENFGWAANMLSYSSRPPDPMLVDHRWRDMWIDRLEQMPFLASTWLSHQHRDEYWKHGSVCEDYSAIEAAVLSIGGWHDGYRNTISHLVENIQSPVKGIVGPWIHKYPHYAAPQPAIGFLQEAKRWWDRWLKDKPTHVEQDPAYRVWLMDSIEPERWLPDRQGRWIVEDEWPSPSVSNEYWHLRENEEGGYLDPGVSAQALDLLVDTSQICGQASGEYFPFAFGPELPDEQSIDDRQSIVFDSSVLINSFDILGAPEIVLSLVPEACAANACVRLCDIRPDGKSAFITHGVINLKHARSSDEPDALTAGRELEIVLSLDQIAYRIPAGHRLRIALSSTYWPYMWPVAVKGGFRVKSGSLKLPCRKGQPASGDEWTFEPPEGAPAWQAQAIRAASSSREITRDETTGIVSTHISNDFGENRDLQHGLLSGSETHECWSIHPDDPLSATVQINWEQNGGRDDWLWSTSVSMAMHCDAEYLHVSGYLVAREGNEVVFEAEYADSIRREFV
ncbi:MAG: CocE/NonD family hydrolase [Granulosicoccus sp.]